jgi:hypothetical protein
MPKTTTHTRILAFPYAESLMNARLDALYDEQHGRRRDLVVDYDELQLSRPVELVMCDGRPCERIQGHYVPRRLRFVGVSFIQRTGFYAHLDDVPIDDDGRRLRGVLSWRPASNEPLCVFDDNSDEPSTLLLSARRVEQEDRSGLNEPIEYVRDWSPPPPLPARLIPMNRQWHQRYAGDPITLQFDGRLYPRQLFVGGLDYQSEHRPNVDAVLNVSEEPGRWTVHSIDRWSCQGEGSYGMTASEMTTEAQWVIDRLRAGQRVLVHCAAGLNRSVTICCATLILLEGLPAEAALDRVREHHPWARPDAHHWLTLRWLADQNL